MKSSYREVWAEEARLASTVQTLLPSTLSDHEAFVRILAVARLLIGLYRNRMLDRGADAPTAERMIHFVLDFLHNTLCGSASILGKETPE